MIELLKAHSLFVLATPLVLLILALKIMLEPKSNKNK
ncbi:hypothetical protein FIV04_26150 (plasmid) [Vibrio sp. THAF190c]|nr:hypothetical protein FIV04_26150 [Vibrio sp. THAF190c]